MTLTEELRKNYAPGVPYFIDSGEQLVCDLLLDAASRYPKRVALDFMNQKTTYQDLVHQVRQAATVLIDSGVNPGDRVALVLPNCPQHVVALFAVTLIGAVAVEHNPLAPEGELQSEFKRHQAKVVVTWENAVEKMPFLDSSYKVFGVNLAFALSRTTRVLLKIPVSTIRERKNMLGAKTPAMVKSWDKEVRNAVAWRGDPMANAYDPAIMLHTGGTTGVPKAVELSHKNLCSNVAQSIAWVPPLHEGSEVFYSILPFFHAFGLTVTLLAAVRLGATIAVFPKFDVAQVLLAQKRLPCTFFCGVPPMFERILGEYESFGTDLTSIRFTLSGAMPLQAELSKRWEDVTGAYVIEGFGMTEASPILLGSPLSDHRRPGALGVPFPSTEIRIVDPEDTDRDVERGEIGELLARGPQVFSGYWKDPKETEVALHNGWLHTGDLVQVRDDGFVYMADRRKELIISGGFNIYPTQVEEVVRAMPGIADVAVVGMPGGSRGEDVVAALVLEAGASVSLDDVREWAEKSLAHYALPRQIVVMQELPRSQIGKVMRRRVQQQLTDLQAGFGSMYSNLASQVSELAGKAGQATTAMKESLNKAASGAGDAAAEFLKGLHTTGKHDVQSDEDLRDPADGENTSFDSE